MPSPTITSGGKDRVLATTKIYTKAFETDPLITYMLCSMSTEKRLAYLPNYFDSLLAAAALNHATFEEADGWASCSVMVPPGYRVDNTFTLLPAGLIPVLWNIGFGGFSRMLLEYGQLTNAAKRKALKQGEKYYYLFFIATQLEYRGRGLSSALIKHYQAIATKDGIPIWLEATTFHSMGIYTKLGFEVIEVMRLGKGKATPDGTKQKGGDGVIVWAMIWRPPPDSVSLRKEP